VQSDDISSRSAGEITRLLRRAGNGSSDDRQQLANAVYDDLRRIAGRIMAKERSDNTLQATLIATEAYMKLVQARDAEWFDRVHFFAAAARAMRRLLVDHSRKRRALKRDTGLTQHGPTDDIAYPVRDVDELLALEQALERLQQRDERQCRIVELRYFGGLKEEEIAELLDLSVRTVKRDWNMARAWLYAELTRGPKPRMADPATS